MLAGYWVTHYWMQRRCTAHGSPWVVATEGTSMGSNAWLSHAWSHRYLALLLKFPVDGNWLNGLRSSCCEKSIFCSLGFTALWCSWTEFSVEKVGKVLYFFQQWTFKIWKELTPQAAIFSVHILESMLETLRTFSNSFHVPWKWDCLAGVLCRSL